MPEKTRVVLKGKEERTVLTESGKILTAPAHWALLPPGDAALTRSVKKAGPTWQIQVKKGRRTYSGGIWAPEETIIIARKELDKKRSTPEYIKKREYTLNRREKLQNDYVGSFYEKTMEYLAFHPNHKTLAIKLAKAVTEHTTPVGSGTVARTQRIAIEQRVQAAVIAWMRHKTTAYDHMKIKRIKGERREIRRELAEISVSLLNRYRTGERMEKRNCPLWNALAE